MKVKFLISLVFLFSFVIPSATADNSITLTEPTHRNAAGIFIDNELATSILRDGRLGNLVFQSSGAATYVIDIALLEEVQDLADGYQYLAVDGAAIDVPTYPAATAWLEALKRKVKAKNLIALPYGSPDLKFLLERAPKELEFYQAVAQERLSAFFGASVTGANLSNLTQSSSASAAAQLIHNTYRPELRALNSVGTASEVVALRLQLAKIINPAIANEKLTELTANLRTVLRENQKKLRITAGNYTITASSYDLPITLINDYSAPLTVKLATRASNSRIIIGATAPLTIDANSQLQIKIPIQVIASGETNLELKLTNKAGAQVGEAKTVALRLAVISPLTTWFTTGMAIILLLAAVTQSVRRVRRRTHE